MNRLDQLRMDRRKIEVEISKLKDKLHELEEAKKSLDKQIVTLVNSGT